jgi:ribosomal protein S18 acetylase RimI-like enzyme
MASPIIDDNEGPESTKISSSTPSYSWEQTIDGATYKLSNDKSLLNLSLFNKAFAGDDVYWTNPMSSEAIDLMVANSCVLGLYKMKPLRLEANHNIKQNTTLIPEQIGFGRLITDYATVAYITDVWISHEYQGKGLGKWMVKGMKEIMDEIPALRRAVLLTKVGGKGVEFYQRELGMRVADPAKDAYGFMEFVPEK